MKITGWDRFLLGTFPKWGMSRIRARAAADMLARHYEAAQPGRRTNGWRRNFGDADLDIRGALTELRNHARDLIRNNGWALRGQMVIANNTVGWGIKAKPAGPLAPKALELWRAWAETTECESEGRHTFYGVQHLAMKTIVESGEVLIRRRWRKPKDNLTIPMQVQILEPDYLDHSKNLFESDAGGPIIQGVEFDKIGRRAAYWLYDKHPGSGRNYNPSRRIDASEVIHVYYAGRPGQSRGVSWLAAAIVKLKDFDEYEDAELMRQKIAACFAAFVTDMDGSGVIPGAAGQPDGTADPLVQTFEPGMIVPLPIGKDIKFAAPPPVTEGGFSARTLRRVAATLGVPYEELTSDYSQVNFSSARMARLAHWANVHDWRWNMLVPLLCDGVWNWAMEAAITAGELPAAADSVPVKWVPPPMPMIEPDKEGLAISRMIRNGLKTHDEAILEQGEDPDEHWKAYADGLKRLDALGIVLDSDARKTTQVGQEQQSEAAINSPAPEPAAPPAKKPPPKAA